jgi:hypothetical protein
MTLTDPRDGLAEQSSFVGYLLGLAGLARMVHALASGASITPNAPRDADDVVYVLLGVASLGHAIERIAEPLSAQRDSTAGAPPATNIRWLR